jgi:hypothetical protein
MRRKSRIQLDGNKRLAIVGSVLVFTGILLFIFRRFTAAE